MNRGTIARSLRKRYCVERKSEDSGLGKKSVETQGEEEVSGAQLVSMLYRLIDVAH